MEGFDYILNIPFDMDCSVKSQTFQFTKQALLSSEDKLELEDGFMKRLPGLGSWLQDMYGGIRKDWEGNEIAK